MTDEQKWIVIALISCFVLLIIYIVTLGLGWWEWTCPVGSCRPY